VGFFFCFVLFFALGVVQYLFGFGFFLGYLK